MHIEVKRREHGSSRALHITPEAAVGVTDHGGWRNFDEILADVRALCIIHDANADVAEFHKQEPRFVERDFATLRACFPVESYDDEEWYHSLGEMNPDHAASPAENFNPN
eukprot:559792-Amphidinium_carterae.1